MLVRIRRKKYPRRMIKQAKRGISIDTLAGVGVRLRMLRGVLDRTQAEWADRLKISRQMLNKWEQGVRQPNMDKLIVICDTTGCTLDFIFRGQVGMDMREGLRRALLVSYGDSPYVSELFAPSVPPPPPSSPARRRRKQGPRSDAAG